MSDCPPAPATPPAGVRVLRLVLGDQLDTELASLGDCEPGRDVVLMAEVDAEAEYVAHHKKKIALVFSAMRHFAEALREHGYRVDYVPIDAPGNTGSLRGELQRAVSRWRPERICLTEPGEWRLAEDMNGWQALTGRPVEIRSDTRFLCSREDFTTWAGGRRGLRMEHFYRWMRNRTGWLMREGKPEGGRWNFDADNRRRFDGAVAVPRRPAFEPDACTQAVLALVARRYARHFGELEPFTLAVTRDQALEALDAFVEHCLPWFGDYQDAMVEGEAFLFHATLSASLNLGLLRPAELCERAEQAWRDGHAPLNAVEGFIRQVLGWREYVRGLYWLHMPGYAQRNHFGASRPLPAFYWTAKTDMACLRDAITQTRRHAYAHHIQRLMLTGNFALLAGLAPEQVCDWYLAVYADAYEWVELPNTLGMALYGDGGVMASKPYCASGAYVRRMSDYCGGCRYDVKRRSGEAACPLNYLYWNFLMENAQQLRGNPRMSLPYRQLDRLPEAEREAVRGDARAFLDALEPA